MSLAAPASRPETTEAVTRGVVRLLAALGWSPVLETPLPNGRRADVMALSPKGEFMIVEVKSSLEDFRCDLKWDQYGPYCDLFYFAVAPEFPRAVLPDDCGLIVADGFGGTILNESGRVALAPARRKALTLAFARLAAMRSVGLSVPFSP